MYPKKDFNKYIVKTKRDLHKILKYEMSFYKQYMFPNWKRFLLARFRNGNIIRIMRWQRLERITEYHDYQYHHNNSYWHLVCLLLCQRRLNLLASKIGMEASLPLVGKGIVFYHYNNVINPGSEIGENCHIHGTVVIGNGGAGDFSCPKIGNNVMIGAGAKIIGGVTIADNIKIGAGAVVVNSFLEPGITIAGVPAKKVK